MAEQQRIVAKIEELAAQIEEARTLRQQTTGEAETLLESQLNRVFSTARDFVSLGNEDICQVVCGQHFIPQDQTDSGIPYMTGPAGSDLGLPSRHVFHIDRAIAQPGDVLLTVKGAGVGKLNLAPQMATAIGRQLFALRPNPKRLHQVFLWYVLQFRLGQFREVMTATTVPGIGRDDVKAIEIPLPPLSEQHRTVTELDMLQVQVNALKGLQTETASELDALLPSILDKAFKGEL